MNVNIKSTKIRKLIKLTNGCERTEVYVVPKNYRSFTNKSEYPKSWFVECRFHDPSKKEEYPKGFQYRKKFTKPTLREMKLYAEVFKGEMEHDLDQLNYNPISRTYMNSSHGELNPNLTFIDAPWKVRDKIPFSEDYLKLSRSLLKLIEKVLSQLRYNDLRIFDTKIWHIKNILEAINTTNSVYNKYRSCLSTMFKELLEYGCVEFNLVSSVSKKMEVAKVRQLLSDRKKSIVLQYLHDNHYEFYRYINIFSFPVQGHPNFYVYKQNMLI